MSDPTDPFAGAFLFERSNPAGLPTVVEIGNVEPDGRMLLTDEEGVPILIVSTGAIDELAEAIRTRCGSDGTGAPARIDLHTGTIEDL